MSPQEIRRRSVERLTRNSVAAPLHLPFLDEFELRSEDEAVDRLASVHLCSAVAYGFARKKALAWADQEGLRADLENEETSFLMGSTEDVRFRYQIEALFGLCWAVGLERSFSWEEAVDDGFVRRLPNLKTKEPLTHFRTRAQLRTANEIAQEADYGYCLHWTIRDAASRDAQQGSSIEEYVVGERRRALEWLMGRDAWYDISLDT